MVNFLKNLFSKKDPEICDICKGVGLSWDGEICPRCKGRKTLDWLEKILGRNVDNEKIHPIKVICKDCGEEVSYTIGFQNKSTVAIFSFCKKCGARGISSPTWVGED